MATPESSRLPDLNKRELGLVALAFESISEIRSGLTPKPIRAVIALDKEEIRPREVAQYLHLRGVQVTNLTLTTDPQTLSKAYIFEVNQYPARQRRKPTFGSSDDVFDLNDLDFFKKFFGLGRQSPKR